MNVIRRSLSLAAAALFVAAAVPTAHADTLKAGFSQERLARVDAVLDSYVNDGRVMGVVALVLRDGKPVYQRAVGWSDKEAGRKMTMDTEFRIASQTKALTSVAILQLVEAGKLSVNDKAGKWIPTFANTSVYAKVPNTTTWSLAPAKRPITLRDLLTHTAGISYGKEPQIAAQYEAKGFGTAAGSGWYFNDKDELICPLMERLGTLPFIAQPGEEWVYGYNTDILGCIVEKASGESLDDYLRNHITGPLGMTDTHFFLPAEKKPRLVTVYASGTDGLASRAPEGQRGQGHYADGPRRNFAGGAGLLSTARDYTRFLEMVRNGGVLGGVRLLSPRAVALMTHNQSGLLHGTSLGFSLAFETTERIGGNGLEPVGAYGWGGAYGSVYRVDPTGRVVMALMMNHIPNATDIRSKFQTLVHQAVVSPPGGATP